MRRRNWSHLHGPSHRHGARGVHRRHHRVTRFIGARLHRRLFVQLGVTILVTMLVTGVVAHLTSGSDHWEQRRSNIETFAAGRFAEVWDESAARSQLADEVSEAFGVKLTLRDPGGALLSSAPGGCRDPWTTLAVPRRSGAGPSPAGYVEVCGGSAISGGRLRFFWMLLSAALVLWLAAGLIARRLGRPLWLLAEVTNRIGAGELGARVRLGRHERGEIGLLAHSINEMAARIEKQMADQRELLAGVSHEIRTPLARLRVIVEMLRGEGAESPRLLDDAEREVLEVDDLTSRLLAASRLEFVALDRRVLDAEALCRESLRRAGLEEDLLVKKTEHTEVEGDATLLGRALLNLLKNAQTHGRFVDSLCLLSPQAGTLTFRVADGGEGIGEAELRRVSSPFVQGAPPGRDPKGSLGLGLALVRRIARAHGGDIAVGRTDEGRSFVEFSVTTTP